MYGEDFKLAAAVRDTPSAKKMVLEGGIKKEKDEMKKAARELRFEEAAYLRDKIKELEITK